MLIKNSLDNTNVIFDVAGLLSNTDSEYLKNRSQRKVFNNLRKIQSGGGFTLGFYEEGVSGSVVIMNNDDLHYKLHSIYLNRDFRGQGIGKRLLGESLDQLVNLNALHLNTTDIWKDNKSSLNLFKSMGFDLIRDGNSYTAWYNFN